MILLCECVVIDHQSKLNYVNSSVGNCSVSSFLLFVLFRLLVSVKSSFFFLAVVTGWFGD